MALDCSVQFPLHFCTTFSIERWLQEKVKWGQKQSNRLISARFFLDCNHCFKWIICVLSFSPTVGHGQSEGDRMVVSDFHVFIRDSLQHIDLMKKEHPELPILILGHSMVSTIPYPSQQHPGHVSWSGGTHVLRKTKLQGTFISTSFTDWFASML